MPEEPATTKATGDRSLGEQLQELVGRTYGEPVVACDPVNAPMIRHLVEAIGDRNPVYTDASFAQRSVHGGVVAPATSLQVWTMQGLPEQERSYREPDPGTPDGHLMSLFEEHGYGAVVATNTEQTYRRYLRPGDLLTMHSVVESIAGPKATALGEGYFVTVVQTYLDQDGDVAGENRIRFLKFRPPAPSGAAMAPLPRSDAGRSSGSRTSAMRTDTLGFDDVEVGAPLPGLSVDLTTTLIVATAIATRDYQYVHHDRDFAHERGLPDVIMNILTTNGFVGRFVTDWAGPEALVRSVSIRLGAPNLPHDTMTMSGSVTGKDVVDGEGIVEVEVSGRNSLGEHVKGRARLTLPRGDA